MDIEWFVHESLCFVLRTYMYVRYESQKNSCLKKTIVQIKICVPWYKFPWFLKVLLCGQFNAHATVKRWCKER